MDLHRTIPAVALVRFPDRGAGTGEGTGKVSEPTPESTIVSEDAAAPESTIVSEDEGESDGKTGAE
jgi:hypothetical protein